MLSSYLFVLGAGLVLGHYPMWSRVERQKRMLRAVWRDLVVPKGLTKEFDAALTNGAREWDTR